MLVINIPMKAINDALNHFLLGLDGTNAFALLGALLVGYDGHRLRWTS